MRLGRFIRQHPAFSGFFLVLILAILGVDGWVYYKRGRYQQEIERLRAGMSEFEKKQVDLTLAAQQEKLAAEMRLIRDEARGEKTIHLSVSIDSGMMYLEREGAVLRTFPVSVGPERRVGTPPDTVHVATPRGARTIERIVGKNDKWEVPTWVYAERSMPAPEDRLVPGALGPVALILDGGTLIYTLPSDGPLADSSYVLPGAVRVSAEDLRTLLPDIKPGTRVYFF